MDLESETSHKDEQTMYTIESKSSVAGWEAIRKKNCYLLSPNLWGSLLAKCVYCAGKIVPLLDVNSVDLNHTTVKHVLILHIHSYMLWSSGQYVILI